MIPDESCFVEDSYGCPTLNVRAEHLEDFPALIAWINEKGYGRPHGFVKLRLHSEDRADSQVIEKALTLMSEKFQQKKYDSKKRKMVPTYNPDVQTFLKAAPNEHIYEYLKCECTPKERKQFVEEALNLSSYMSPKSNCCTEILHSSDLDALREHLFDAVNQASTFTDSVKQNLEELGAAFQEKVQGTPFVYGAGIQVDPNNPIKICRQFSLSTLNTVIDHLDDKYDGIAYPYLYVGSNHTVFPWHIEDGGLYSINYLMGGMNKIWFVFPPEYYGVIDNISSRLRIHLGHTSCRALLADHKALVLDPSFLASVHGQLKIPFKMIVQEPGDFVVTFPFALHSGANLGLNLAIAANFGDVDWIELGMYAPICSCSDTQVQLNLTNLMRLFRPDLLNTYLTSPCLLPPLGHPCDVLPITTTIVIDNSVISPAIEDAEGNAKGSLMDETFEVVETGRLQKEDNHLSGPSNTEKGRGKRQETVKEGGKKSNVKSCILHCPGCSQTFTEKLSRLQKHIQKKHCDDADNLLRIVTAKYKKVTKTGLKFMCKVCKKVLRGSSTHVQAHHSREHQNMPFEGALKA